MGAGWRGRGPQLDKKSRKYYRAGKQRRRGKIGKYPFAGRQEKLARASQKHCRSTVGISIVEKVGTSTQAQPLKNLECILSGIFLRGASRTDKEPPRIELNSIAAKREISNEPKHQSFHILGIRPLIYIFTQSNFSQQHHNPLHPILSTELISNSQSIVR